MTEYSMFWDGCSVGDARLAPYPARVYRSFWDRVLVSDGTRFAPIACTPSGAGLKVTIGGAAQLNLSEGSAIIDGVYYWTDGVALATVTPAATGYSHTYTVALRKTQSAKQVRAVLLGPNIYAGYPSGDECEYPVVTQNDDVWEVPIAYAFSDFTGLLAVHDHLHRITPNHSQLPALIFRQGGHANDWHVQGTTSYELDERGKVQVGCSQWTGTAASSGNVAVTFPVPYTYVPNVFVNPHMSSIASLCISTQQTVTTLTIYWQTYDGSTRTSLTFDWFAYGTLALY